MTIAKVSGVAVEVLHPGVSKVRLSGVALQVLRDIETIIGSAWNPADASSNVVLSNSNYTATTNTTAAGGVRGADKKTAGKYYVELDSTGWSGNDGVGGNGFGIANASAILASLGSNHAVNAAMAMSSSSGLNRLQLYVNGSAINNIGGPGPTDMAVDLDANLIWFRVNGGNWNDNSANSPATGVGGINISAIVSGGVFLVASFLNQLTTLTLRTGGNMQRPIPTGFTAGWPETSSAPPTARVTQDFAEVLRTDLDIATARVTQDFLEVLRTDADFVPAPARMTQDFLEVLRTDEDYTPDPLATARLTQGYAEVLINDAAILKRIKKRRVIVAAAGY